jgi:hydrogenase maturation protein HypF
MRPGRGIAPIELELEQDHALAAPLIATGGHMKNTLALAWENRVVVSPHIGDLDSPRSQDVFERTIADLQHLYNVTAKRIVCDAHPGYASSRWARAQNMPVEAVQHHHAHASSLAGEHPDVKHWLVFTWDGVGYGSDGSMWGGEALSGGPGNWQRVASFRPFHLLGGDRAGREPWRSAAALMWAEGVDWTAPVEAAGLARDAWQRRITTFETTAVGRLFDAASALILDRSVASFEGQGPMELEAIAVPGSDPLRLPLICDQNGILRSDWGPLLPVISDHGLEPAERAGIFHQSMAQALVDQALELARNRRFDAIGLSGGVFQNRLLVETVLAKLAGHGIDVRLHQQLPANDGGLCYGQVIETLARDREDVSHTENSE